MPREKVKELRKLGWSSTRIAKYLRCTEDAVQLIINEIGLSRSYYGPEPISTFPNNRSQVQLAYLAGLVDGEGTVTFIKSPRGIGGKAPILMVTNSDIGVMKWLIENFNGRIQTSQPKGPRMRKAKHVWHACGYLSVRDALIELIPYLIIKHQKAMEVLEYCNWLVLERRRRADKKHQFKSIPID